MDNLKVNSILIIGSSELPLKKRIGYLASRSDCIIAADGGANQCYQHKMRVDYIVGDMDSIKPEVLEYYKVRATIIERPDQNTHDLMKAIQFAATLKPQIIRAIGVFGKRFDHSMANLLAMQSMNLTIPIEFHEQHGWLQILHTDHKLHIPIGTTVSLFSFLPVNGLSLFGFKYLLQDKDYPNGFNGLSNETTHPDPTISIKQGSLFLYIVNENT